MINPNKNIVSTNPAMLPKSIWENFKSQNFENMINYHSKFDILSWLQDHCHSDTRKTSEFRNWCANDGWISK